MIKKLSDTEDNGTTLIQVRPKQINWDELKLTENVIVFQRVTIREAEGDLPEWINATYAVRQPNNKWIWIVGGVTSLTCAPFIGDYSQNKDFDTLDECIDHYLIFWTVNNS